MKIRVNTIGFFAGRYSSPGDVVDVDDATGFALIKTGQGIRVDTKDTGRVATAAPAAEPERAVQPAVRERATRRV